MNKNKSAITALVIIISLVAIVGLFFLSRQGNNKKELPTENDMILFYSLSCPHCQNVEKYIEDNAVTEKYSFDRLEISNNRDNSAKLVEKAKICGLETQGLGVPFLWTGEKCLMGDADIIEFFKK
jgi:glutaredoxin